MVTAVRKLVYATGEVARRLDDLQFTLGEGPCLDVFTAHRPLNGLDLDEVDGHRRTGWPGGIVVLVRARPFAAQSQITV